MSPTLPVEVEVDATGTWSVDGVPMVLVPRHLIVNTLVAAEQAATASTAAAALRDSGRRSAQQWCAHQAERHGLDAVTVVGHYLDQLSRRGWGRFVGEVVDPHGGRVVVAVESSALVVRAEPDAEGACWLFAPWIEGALDRARESLGLPGSFTVTETRCAARGAPRCVFEGATP